MDVAINILSNSLRKEDKTLRWYKKQPEDYTEAIRASEELCYELSKAIEILKNNQ